MADSDPTGRGKALALTIPAADAPFLIDTLATARWGANEDLANHPNEVREPARLRREAAAYSQLIDAVTAASIKPTRYLCQVLSTLAGTIDEENDYEVVVFEHGALHGLLGQVEGALA